MIREVPCVVTDIGDSALLVGKTGLIVPPRDPEALAAAWADLLPMPTEDRRALGRHARQRILDNYSLEKMVTAYANLYQDIITHDRFRK
jgi:glycosyltransferase involved in cell wall biosynthesis